MKYSYKGPSVWTIPRFVHQKGPLVFRVLEVSLGLENSAWIAEMEINNILGGSGGGAPRKHFDEN